MTEDEIAFRAAINVLTVESGRMPSGWPLAPNAADLHERETLVRRLVAGPQP